MTDTFLTILFLLFFLFFYASYSSSVPQPKHSLQEPEPYQTQLIQSGDSFQFQINGRTEWEAVVPDPFVFENGRIVPKNPCSGFKNMLKLPATGQALYDYLRDNPLNYPDGFSFGKSETPLGKGNVFYFTCRNDSVYQLSMCPSGQVFEEGECQAIHACTGFPDGTVLPDDQKRVDFYRVCEMGKPVYKQCKKDTFFFHDSCRPMKDAIHYCDFFEEPRLLDKSTRMECRNGKLHFQSCSPGFQFFDVSHCESIECVNQPDGTRLPLPKETVGPFTFSPGYSECRGGRIVQTVSCPKRWNFHRSKGDNLTHLPMVFDGSECAVPSFCDNVTSDDPDVLVPVHEFTKKVANWKYSELFDRTTGYECQGKSLKRRVPLDPGEWIHSKRFKREHACTQQVVDFKVPVSGKPTDYFDCSTKSTMQCNPSEEHFDGTGCVPSLKEAFEYNGIGFFHLGPLSFDEWIPAWGYSTAASTPVCTPPEIEYLSIYGVCSHPDCTKYAFLSQLPNFPILLQDQKSKCTFDRNERKLVKKPVHFSYDFWTQRQQDGSNEQVDEPPCVPGENLQTGHFVWDSVIYKTCQQQQPFIFCPSSVHKGIVKLATLDPLARNPDQYACKPPPPQKVQFGNKNEFTAFQNKELKALYTLDKPTHLNIKETSNAILQAPNQRLDISNENQVKIRTQHPIELEYQYRVTYPPNVAFKGKASVGSVSGVSDQWEAQVGSNKQAYLVKTEGFTTFRVDFADYAIESPMVDFATST